MFRFIIFCEATKILQAWFEANIVNPYPTELQKKALIEETGLPPAQVISIQYFDPDLFDQTDMKRSQRG